MTTEQWKLKQESAFDQAHSRRTMIGKVVEIQGVRTYTVKSKKYSPIQHCDYLHEVLK